MDDEKHSPCDFDMDSWMYFLATQHDRDYWGSNLFSPPRSSASRIVNDVILAILFVGWWVALFHGAPWWVLFGLGGLIFGTWLLVLQSSV
jgi:hypothetical protein